VERSNAVRNGLLRFYECFSSGDVDAFADVIASGPGVSLISTEPGPAAGSRESWLHRYATQIVPLGVTFRAGDNPTGYEEGTVGFATDTPTAFLPDGNYAPTRITAVLHQEGGQWKVVHLHVSVGVPDEEAIQPAS
jgi:ketosteroid isomerase-like protein